jgi:hypothetical protein
MASASGVRNPLTFSGTIIVDGVAASVHSLYFSEALLGSAIRYVPAALQLFSLPVHALIHTLRHMPAPLGPVFLSALTSIGELLDDESLAPAPVRSVLGISVGLLICATAILCMTRFFVFVGRVVKEAGPALAR